MVDLIDVELFPFLGVGTPIGFGARNRSSPAQTRLPRMTVIGMAMAPTSGGSDILRT
jgi:hypothetical protein